MSLLFHLHVYSEEILSQAHPPLTSSSHQLSQLLAPLGIC